MIRGESGQIARALAEHRYDLQQAQADNSTEPGSIPESSAEMDAMTDHLFLTSEGLGNQLRLEGMITRQLNHAIAELERGRLVGRKRPEQPVLSELRNKAKKSFSFNRTKRAPGKPVSREQGGS